MGWFSRFSRNRGLRLEAFVDPKLSVMSIASGKVLTCNEGVPIEGIIPALSSQYRRLPVVTKQGDFRGIITTTDVLDYLGAGEKHSLFRKRRGSLKIQTKGLMETEVFPLDKNSRLDKALKEFHIRRRGSYPVTYRGKLFGIVSEWDFVKQLNGRIGTTVEELMVKKPFILKPDFRLLEAAKIMVRGRFRRLPVAKEGILLGILTPRDVLAYLSRDNKMKNLRRDRTPVRKAMNREVVTIRPGADISLIAKVMIDRKIGGIPVTEDGELLGIVTERDIVDALKV